MSTGSYNQMVTGSSWKAKFREQRRKHMEGFNDISTYRELLDLMVHAFQFCKLPRCKDRNCLKIKEMYRQGLQCHGTQCGGDQASCGCDLCTKMWYFLQLHARSCRGNNCYVPLCSYMKQSMKTAVHQKIPCTGCLPKGNGGLLRSPRDEQAAVMELSRQIAAEVMTKSSKTLIAGQTFSGTLAKDQATEAAVDKMDHLSVGDAAVAATVDEEDVGVVDKHLSVADAAVATMDEEDYYFPDVVVDKMGHLSIAEVVLDTVDELNGSIDDDEWTLV